MYSAGADVMLHGTKKTGPLTKQVSILNIVSTYTFDTQKTLYYNTGKIYTTVETSVPRLGYLFFLTFNIPYPNY